MLSAKFIFPQTSSTICPLIFPIACKFEKKDFEIPLAPWLYWQLLQGVLLEMPSVCQYRAPCCNCAIQGRFSLIPLMTASELNPVLWSFACRSNHISKQGLLNNNWALHALSLVLMDGTSISYMRNVSTLSKAEIFSSRACLSTRDGVILAPSMCETIRTGDLYHCLMRLR